MFAHAPSRMAATLLAACEYPVTISAVGSPIVNSPFAPATAARWALLTDTGDTLSPASFFHTTGHSHRQPACTGSVSVAACGAGTGVCAWISPSSNAPASEMTKFVMSPCCSAVRCHAPARKPAAALGISVYPQEVQWRLRHGIPRATHRSHGGKHSVPPFGQERKPCTPRACAAGCLCVRA